jgi:uncharacterized protein
VAKEVVVRGHSEVPVVPDRAVVWLLVDGDGPTREDAYGAAARSAATVDEVLAAEAGSLSRVTTTALVVQPRTRWRKGESVRSGWRATRRSTVEIVVLDRVGEILSRLAGAGATLSDLSWELDPGNEAYDRCRRQAAQDARRRARQYAQALGLTLTGVAWVTEPGMGSGPSVPQPRMHAALAAPAGFPEMPEEPIEVTPGEIIVRAAVDVGFTIGAEEGGA